MAKALCALSPLNVYKNRQLTLKLEVVGPKNEEKNQPTDKEAEEKIP